MNWTKNICVMFLTCFAWVGYSAPSTIKGSINFKGKAPKMEAIKMNADPKCVEFNQGKKVLREDVVVNPNGTLANVFVYVKEGVNKASAPASTPAPLTFDQHGCTYIPHVFGLQVNQTLKILNSDATLHNVHSLAKQNPNFNQGMPQKGQVIEKKFTKPETMIRIKCDVHGWMNAYVGVLDHPYFAVTDTSGAYSIPNLPPGNYTVEAWHEKFGSKTEKVTLADAGGEKSLDFAFESGKAMP